MHNVYRKKKLRAKFNIKIATAVTTIMPFIDAEFTKNTIKILFFFYSLCIHFCRKVVFSTSTVTPFCKNHKFQLQEMLDFFEIQIAEVAKRNALR